VDFRIRRASLDDVPALAAFGARTFAEAFGDGNTREDMAAYLAAAYGEAQQRAEVTDSRVATLIAEQDAAIAAFAQVRRGSDTPPCVATQAPVELWRFYVDRRWHGTGLARQLMRAARASARDLGGASVWLSVWERNPRAIAFYTKCGFADVGTKSFQVGSDCQTDRVLVAALADADRL
jgi:diamine N-acetyltransferase